MTSDTVQLNHRAQGPPDAPTVFLAGSLGTTLAMWDSLADALAASYHVVRLDLRGHGSSPAPPGPYTMSELAGDVVALADELGVARFAFVGLSLGGAVGQTLAVEHPDRLVSLVLCCTAPSFGAPEDWRERAARVTAEGTAFLVETTRERWFTPEFLEKHPERAQPVLDMLANTSPIGYAGCCDANATYDVTGRLGEITTPTRVIAGEADPVTPPDVTRGIADAVTGADHVVIANAAHIANVAEPDNFNSAVAGHLDRTVRA